MVSRSTTIWNGPYDDDKNRPHESAWLYMNYIISTWLSLGEDYFQAERRRTGTHCPTSRREMNPANMRHYVLDTLKMLAS